VFLGSAPPDDFVGSLRQMVRALLSDGCPQIEGAAETAGLSVRTLQRRLSSFGLSYSDLVQQTRCEEA
jgi:AraC-like DNA-binding protein